MMKNPPWHMIKQLRLSQTLEMNINFHLKVCFLKKSLFKTHMALAHLPISIFSDVETTPYSVTQKILPLQLKPVEMESSMREKDVTAISMTIMMAVMEHVNLSRDMDAVLIALELPAYALSVEMGF